MVTDLSKRVSMPLAFETVHYETMSMMMTVCYQYFPNKSFKYTRRSVVALAVAILALPDSLLIPKMGKEVEQR